MNICVLMFTEVGKENPSASSRLRTMRLKGPLSQQHVMTECDSLACVLA